MDFFLQILPSMGGGVPRSIGILFYIVVEVTMNMLLVGSHQLGRSKNVSFEPIIRGLYILDNRTKCSCT